MNVISYIAVVKVNMLYLTESHRCGTEGGFYSTELGVSTVLLSLISFLSDTVGM